MQRDLSCQLRGFTLHDGKQAMYFLQAQETPCVIAHHMLLRDERFPFAGQCNGIGSTLRCPCGMGEGAEGDRRARSHSVNQHIPFSTAPKEFPGLGRRKREARLAEIKQLYDHYIVGPATWRETCLGADGDSLETGHELAARWRRGRFRLRPHGPQATLRKVSFIAPTIVRVDRLGSIIETA